MTIVVAVEDPQGVALAWDTAVTDEHNRIDTGVQKAQLVRPWLGLALAGDVTPGMVLRYEWDPPVEPPRDVERWVNYELIMEWREILAPWEKKMKYPIEALVAFRGAVWCIDDGLSAHRSRRGYSVIGSGTMWAEGALGALAPIRDARAAAVRSVEVACEHGVGLRAPGGPGCLWVPAWA